MMNYQGNLVSSERDKLITLYIISGMYPAEDKTRILVTMTVISSKGGTITVLIFRCGSTSYGY